jgi:MarR family multiple gene transcriptional regulator MgrA
MEKEDIGMDIGILIKIIEKNMEKYINKNLKNFNITATQENVLWIIFHKNKKGNDVFQKDIEKELDLSNPTVTGIVKRLEEKQLIKRLPSLEDGRYKCLTLTDTGKEVIHKSMDFGVNYIEKKITKDMSENEIKTLKELLIKVINNMEE